MKMLTMIGLISIVGCADANASFNVVAPTGEHVIGITCNSNIRCMELAGIECPNGYQVQDENGHWSMQSDQRAFVSGSVGSEHGHTGEVFRGEWVVKCAGESRIELEQWRHIPSYNSLGGSP